MQKSYPTLSQGLPHELCDYHSLPHVTTRFAEKKKENRIYDPKLLNKLDKNLPQKLSHAKTYPILSQGLPQELCDYHRLPRDNTRFAEKKKEYRV